MEENNYSIYKHINKINGFIYIGITSLKPEKRWGINGKGYIGQYFYTKGISIYGWDNFEHIILFNNLTKKEAEEMEIELISFHKSNEDGFGYNKTNGGESHAKMTPEIINKIKANIKTKKKIICLETKQIFESIHDAGYNLGINFKNISQVCNGSKKSANGLHFLFLDQYYENIKRNIDVNNLWYKKKIICLETKTIYNSISDASKELNISANSISAVCNHHINSTHKLHFLFLNDYDENKEYSLKISKNTGTPIICINTKQKFNSIAEAGRYFNIPEKSFCHISDVCKNKIRSVYGLRFCYLEDYSEKILNKKFINKNAKKVICVNTKQIFNSIKECAKELGLNQGKISQVCNQQRKTTGGLSFRFYIDNEK